MLDRRAILSQEGEGPQLEYCDHLTEGAPRRERFPIVLKLGVGRVLILCHACGAALKADILESIITDAVRGYIVGRMEAEKQERQPRPFPVTHDTPRDEAMKRLNLQ